MVLVVNHVLIRSELAEYKDALSGISHSAALVGLAIGDRVQLVCRCDGHERGWGAGWNTERGPNGMDFYVGKVGVVEKIHDLDVGVKVHSDLHTGMSNWSFPAHCLVKIVDDSSSVVPVVPVVPACGDDEFVCADCDEVCKSSIEEFFNSDTNRVCESCGEDYVVCSHCGDVIHVDDSESHEGDYYCSSCFYRYFFTCNRCDHVFSRDERRIGSDDEQYCDSCFCDCFCHCDSCDEVISLDEVYYDDGSGEHYCCRCWNDHRQLKDDAVGIIRNVLRYKSAGLFGVEIEANVEDDYEVSDSNLKHFMIVNDGSLDESVGREFVTTVLPFNVHGFKVLSKFCNEFGRDKLSVDSSCGLHVHYYVRQSDVTLDNFRKIVHSYRVLEDLFFSMVPRSRRSNNYCYSIRRNRHCRDDGTTRPFFLDYLLYDDECKSLFDFARRMYDNSYIRDGDFDSIPHDKYHGSRYYWVNLNSIFYRNTLEIRLHPGTVNSKKILRWSRIHKLLLDWLFSHSWEETQSLMTRDFFLYHILDKKLSHYVFQRIDKFSSHSDDSIVMNDYRDENRRISHNPVDFAQFDLGLDFQQEVVVNV